MTQPAGTAISVDSVRKTYGATIALDDVSLTIPAGSVHALLGENGAGKSTMVKLLSGLIRPDTGHIAAFGQAAELHSPRDAHRLGIQTAFQELTLVPDLTVWENVLLPYQPTGFAGLLRARRGAATVAELLAQLGIAGVSPHQLVRDLDLPVRQKIEIARTLFRKPRILLLDEPTSALSGGDIEWLADIVAAEKARGATVVFISHRMPEVRLFCDALSVLRNGRNVGTYEVAAVTDHDVVELIIGRSLTATFPPKPERQLSRPDRRCPSPICPPGAWSCIALDLRPGEILGIAGLQGMGQQELFQALFGDTVMTAAASRRWPTGDAALRQATPSAADRLRLVPEDRKTEGLFLKLDGRRNVSLPVIDRFIRLGLIDGRGANRRRSPAHSTRVQVRPTGALHRAGALQRRQPAEDRHREMAARGSRVLLLFDPTRGVDVGTKHEIYLLMQRLCTCRRRGLALLHRNSRGDQPEPPRACHVWRPDCSRT